LAATLIADSSPPADLDTYDADLELSRVTPLKVAATQPHRRGGIVLGDSIAALMGCARQVLGAMRPDRCVSVENQAAGVPIRVGVVSTLAPGLPGSANDSHQAHEKPEPTRSSSASAGGMVFRS